MAKTNSKATKSNSRNNKANDRMTGPVFARPVDVNKIVWNNRPKSSK